MKMEITTVRWPAILISLALAGATYGADPVAPEKKAEPAKPAAAAPAVAAEPAKPATPAAPAVPADPKDVKDKLIKLTTLEQAFGRADRDRKILAQQIVQEQAKLKAATTDADKEKINKDLDEAKKKFQTISIAMEIVFGIGNRRDYEYNDVKSTVYLRVGTVEECFARSVQIRDALKKFVIEQKALKDAEKDKAKQDEIEKKIENATKQYQVVAASLQVVFGVTTQRDYEYNPKNSTLYLKVSENELAKLKEQLTKLQEEQAAKAKTDTPAPAPAPAPAAGK